MNSFKIISSNKRSGEIISYILNANNLTNSVQIYSDIDDDLIHLINEDANSIFINIGKFPIKSDNVINVPLLRFDFYFLLSNDRVGGGKYRINKKYPIGVFPWVDVLIKHKLLLGYSKDEILSDLDSMRIPSVKKQEQIIANEQAITNFSSGLSALNQKLCQQIILSSKQEVLALSPVEPNSNWYHLIGKFIVEEYCNKSYKKVHIPCELYKNLIQYPIWDHNESNESLIFWNELVSLKIWVSRYIDFFCFGGVPAKDPLDISRAQYLINNKLYLDCSYTRLQFRDNKMTEFVKYYDSQANIVIIFDSTSEAEVQLHKLESEKEITFVPGVKITFTGKGNLVVLHKGAKFQNSHLLCGTNTFVYIGKSVFNGLFFTNRVHSGGSVIIGDNIFAPERVKVHLYGNNQVKIGDGCMLADSVKIMAGDAHTIFDENGFISNIADGVEIQENVWLAFDVKVLKNTFIPKGCAVATGAVVASKFSSSHALLGGVPAKIIKTNIRWDVRNPEWL